MVETNPRKLKNQAKAKFNEYKRVLKISEKPDWDEFSMSAKITGAGIVIIGAIGFAFYILKELVLDVFFFA
jgi:protein transport protein SEC61 subunit gamma-like protein